MIASAEQFLELVGKFLATYPTAVAIVLAVVGYALKHVSDVRVRRLDARIGFVTSQLRDLYGPLFILAETNDKSWSEFRARFRPDRPMFSESDPLNDVERGEYCRWLGTVFVPCNEKMRMVIERNAHLFEHSEPPREILQLLAHFDELNVVLSKLKDGTDSNVFPNLMYPKEFSATVRRDYHRVAKEHAQLTAKRHKTPKAVVEGRHTPTT
jgi:hypothetical protein